MTATQLVNMLAPAFERVPKRISCDSDPWLVTRDSRSQAVGSEDPEHAGVHEVFITGPLAMDWDLRRMGHQTISSPQMPNQESYARYLVTTFCSPEFSHP